VDVDDELDVDVDEVDEVEVEVGVADVVDVVVEVEMDVDVDVLEVASLDVSADVDGCSVTETVTTSVMRSGNSVRIDESTSPKSSSADAVIVKTVVSVSAASDVSDAAMVTVMTDCQSDVETGRSEDVLDMLAPESTGGVSFTSSW
jgi:hypothetical protein